MKKFLTLLGLMAIVAVSCSKKEFEYPTPEKGVPYVFEGTVATDGFTWNTASQIGIYGLTDGLSIMNEVAQIEGYAVSIPYVDEETGETIYPEITPSEYEGKAVAPFNTPGLDLLKGENEFLVYAPYDEEMSYIPSLGVIYNLSVAKAQTQTVPNVAGACFSLGKVKGIPGVDEKFSFTLNPVTALLKVTVASSEFVGYGLKKVTIIDDEGTAKLGGTFDVNVDDLSFEEAATFSEISTTITAPSDMASGEKQSIYINVLPGDFSKEFTFIVELQGTNGNVIIPMKKSLGVLEAGKTTELSLTDLKSSDNMYKWFCPVENRKLVGCDYAYGDANTYLIQCKTAVYGGGSVNPVAEIPDEVVIDYRLRGDYTQAEIPDNVTFEWATTDGASKKALPRKDAGNTFVADGLSFTVDPANYKVTVKNEKATGGAPILLMKNAEGKILWGWAFWNIAADGTKLEAINVGGYDVANMNIGEATTDRENWIKTEKLIVRTMYYYQFGRYLPATYWNSYWSHSQLNTGITAGNLPGLNGPFTTLKESLEWPYGGIMNPDDPQTAMNNWTEEYVGDLWGCVLGDDKAEGTKSIYDPCPKGWRVPDHAVISKWGEISGTAPAKDKYVTTAGLAGLNIDNMFLPYAGYVNYYKVTDTKGYRVANNGTTGSFTATQASYFSNYCASHSASSPFVYMFYGPNQLNEKNVCKAGQQIRSVSTPIRCQKDKYNR